MPKPKLGRGLDVLIPNKSGLTGGRTIMNLPLSEIKENPFQARKIFDEQKIAELAESIREHGVVQPIVVRRVGEVHELVAGERRLRASKVAGLTTIPVIIKDYLPEQAMAISLIENLQRENLNSIEEASAFQRLAQEFRFTQEEIAKKVGKSRSVIANAMRLLSLPAEVQESIQGGLLSSSHGRNLASIKDEQEQIVVWRKMLEGDFNVRQAEAAVSINKKKATSSSAKNPPQKSDFVLDDLLDTLSRHLGTKVTLKGSRSNGVLQIHYYSQSDLERIVEAIA